MFRKLGQFRQQAADAFGLQAPSERDIQIMRRAAANGGFLMNGGLAAARLQQDEADLRAQQDQEAMTMAEAQRAAEMEAQQQAAARAIFESDREFDAQREDARNLQDYRLQQLEARSQPKGSQQGSTSADGSNPISDLVRTTTETLQAFEPIEKLTIDNREDLGKGLVGARRGLALAFGMNPGELTVAEADEMERFTASEVLKKAEAIKGALSDKDLQFLKDASLNPLRNPDAFLAATDVIRQAQARAVAMEQAYNAIQGPKPDAQQFMDRYIRENPLDYDVNILDNRPTFRSRNEPDIGDPPPGITPDVWGAMTPEERQEWSPN